MRVICRLSSAAPEGTRTFKFTTDGRTCSKNVVFDIVGEDQILKNVVYEGGCNGGTQGTTRSTEIYLSIREDDLTVEQKKKCGEEEKREIMGWKE